MFTLTELMIFPMENEQKICYQFCSAITNLALALGGGGGGGESQGTPPLYETLVHVLAGCHPVAIAQVVEH